MKVNPSKIVPLRNVILVKLLDVDKVTDGGIYLPEVAADKAKVEHKVGTVLAVGPGERLVANGQVVSVRPPDVSVGQTVIFDPPYAARVRGHDDLYLVEDTAVLAYVE